MMPNFKFYSAKSLADAVAYLAEHRGEAKIISGGTDLILQMSQGKLSPKYLISIRDVPGLGAISAENGNVTIGANVTHRQAELSEYVKNRLPALHDAVTVVGSVQVRNTATIAGNICNAVPSADTACPLLTLGAKVNILGPGGARVLPLKDFWTGPGKNALRPDELVTGIVFDEPKSNAGAYIKYTRRKAMDLSMAGVAVYVVVEGGRVVTGRVALGTLAPTPVRACAAENLLKGAVINAALYESFGAATLKDAKPRSSWRATAEYRGDILPVLSKRCLELAISRARFLKQPV